jgi:hypothetical protein
MCLMSNVGQLTLKPVYINNITVKSLKRADNSILFSLLCTKLTILSKKSRPHLDVERGWSGANEHFTQQNSNINYRIYL